MLPVPSFHSAARSIVPAVAMVGFTIGTGSVTSMAKAGAEYGMSLLWALAVSCAMAYVLFSAFGKITAVTGCGALEAIRRHIHPAVGLFILLAVTFNVCTSIMGVMGIVADILHRAWNTWSDEAPSAAAIAAVLSITIAAILVSGSFRLIETILALLAGIMGVCFLANAGIVAPPVREILGGLIPQLPHGQARSGMTEGYLVTASIVGTTVAPVLFLFRSIMIREHLAKQELIEHQRRDALVSAILIFIVSGAIMASAAGQLRSTGYTLQEAGDMIPLLRPVAGATAVAIFIVGITAAGISSQFPNVLSIICMRRDYQGRTLDLKNTIDRFIVISASLLGLVVPLFHARPVWMMVMSQSLNAIVLPITVLCAWWLLNDPRIMGASVHRTSDNISMAAVTACAAAIAALGAYGIVGNLT